MKVALGQMLVEPGEKQANLARAESCIAQAAQQGAEVVLLPEAMPLGWTHPSARNLADEVPAGESCARLREAAPGVCLRWYRRTGRQPPVQCSGARGPGGPGAPTPSQDS